VRKCVVKIKRIKIQERYSRESHQTNDAETSTFEPARNSTMCYSPNVQMQKKTNGPKKNMQGNTLITPCRVRLQRISPNKPALEDSTVKPSRFFHRNLPPPRSRSSVTRNVYEFLSQSQIEDCNREDPAADIIQRLVKDGRACVMMRTNGKSRAKPVKRERVKPVGKRRLCSLKKNEPDSKDALQHSKESKDKHTNRPLSPIHEPLDDITNDAVEASSERFKVPVQVQAPPSPAQQNTLKQASDGAYSHLARSVLLNQTKTQDTQNSDRRRELVNMARQLISTPLNAKATAELEKNTTTAGISPIPRPLPTTMGGSSPWRVSDESAMPNTFVFGFNTSQLPSYSSDHIRRGHVYMPNGQRQEESICPAINEHNDESNPNDSNEENLPPSKTLVTSYLENSENVEDAENFVQLPNPRITLQKRTPFKDINILDVVVLPSWKNNIITTPSKEVTPIRVTNPPGAAFTPPNRSQTRANLFGFDDMLTGEDDSNKSSEGNLFGFEEFLTEAKVTSVERPVLSVNVPLHDKLQRLRELRPDNKELPNVSTAPLRQDCLGEVHSRQVDIRNAFSSTMIGGTPMPQRKQAPAANVSVGLFRENEAAPEITLDDKKPRRTYLKERPKRKRKQRVHILFVESGSSEEEDEQDSQDNSYDSPQKQRKRPRKDVEQDAKLQEFITSFNKECEEVEKFPVIIE
ncbi:hypothetical protein KR009_010814, partial [Drosophila setifemur]